MCGIELLVLLTESKLTGKIILSSLARNELLTKLESLSMLIFNILSPVDVTELWYKGSITASLPL